MGIKAGSGKGAGDAGGTRGKPFGGGVGSSSKRDKKPPMQIPPKKPLRPIENPFPEKKEFRLGHYRILEERDNYLLCTGYDPNAKNPFAEVTPDAFRTGVLMKVAKPPMLQRTAVEAAGPVTIDGIAYTYTYSDLEYGVRTASWTDGTAQEEEQRIYMPYLVGDLLVAVEIRKNAWVDGMEVTDEEGTRLRWIDLNVSGRHWKSPATSGTIDVVGDIGSAWTITEYEAITGEPIRTFYRGLSRTEVPTSDIEIIATSDGNVLANGSTNINRDNGIGVLYNGVTGAHIWESDNNGLSAVTSIVASPPAARNGSRRLIEASDGFYWLAGTGSIARIDPADGRFTHRVPSLGGAAAHLLPCQNAGSVIMWPGRAADGDLISIIDSSGNRTHGFSAFTPLDRAEGAGIIAVISATNLRILDASDLTQITTNGGLASQVSVCTDGTTAWVLTNEATKKIRAYDVTDVTTELWSATVTADGASNIIYNPINGQLYSMQASTLRKFDSATGVLVWDEVIITSTTGRMQLGFGSDFLILSTSASQSVNVFCLEDSDGSTRWSDYVGLAFIPETQQATAPSSAMVYVDSADRILVGHTRKRG